MAEVEGQMEQRVGGHARSFALPVDKPPPEVCGSGLFPSLYGEHMHAQLSPACMRDLGGTAVGRALPILGEWLLVTIFVVDAWSSLIYIFCSPVALKYLSNIY